MCEFIGLRVESVDSVSVGTDPYESGLRVLMKTKYGSVAHSGLGTEVTFRVGLHLAAADLYQAVSHAAGPDVSICVGVQAFD